MRNSGPEWKASLATAVPGGWAVKGNAKLSETWRCGIRLNLPAELSQSCRDTRRYKACLHRQINYAGPDREGKRHMQEASLLHPANALALSGSQVQSEPRKLQQWLPGNGVEELHTGMVWFASNP